MKMNYKKLNKAIKASAFAVLFGTCAVAAFFAAGCGTSKAGVPHQSAAGIADRYTAEEDKIAVFTEGLSGNFYASDGYGNNFPFNCKWSSGSITCEDDTMSLTVSKADDGTYYGAEYRSYSSYSYGFYSVCMKAAKCSGIVSSFFTYTNRPWDEIDIEFLGKDTTGLQFNYYTSGEGGHEYWYELGFDGSEDFHEYAFYWQEDSITWYVDGKAVYRATENIPVTETKIMMNVWNGTGDSFNGWCGTLDESGLPATAQYKWIAYSPD